MIKVDIVIPVYNKEISIKKTLRSVINQEVKFDKIIVVNDGSTDNTKKIIKSFKDSYTDINIDIIDQKNQGVSEARNSGIKFSNADYITLLDGDDELEFNYLSEIKNLINKHEKSNAFSTKHINIYSAEQSKKYEYLKKSKKYKNKIIKYPLLTNAFSKNIFCASGITFAKSLLSKNLFPKNIKIGEDIYIWQKIFSNQSLAISNGYLIRINKYAENRSEQINDDFPYYLKNFKLSDYDFKNIIFKLSIIIFQFTSLFIEINKFKYKNKKFNSLLIEENIVYNFVKYLINNKISYLIYFFYLTIKKIFTHLNINLMELICYSLITPTAPIIFFILYFKGYDYVSTKYLIYSSFNLVFFSLLTFQTKTFLVNEANEQILSQNIFLRILSSLIFIIISNFIAYKTLNNVDYNIYTFSSLIVSIFWIIDFMILFNEKNNQKKNNFIILACISVFYTILIFYDINFIINYSSNLVFFASILFISLIFKFKKIKANNYFFNILDTFRIIKFNYGLFFFISGVSYVVSNFLFRYQLNIFIDSSLLSNYFFIFSIATFPSSFYQTVFAQYSSNNKYLIKLYYLGTIIFLLFTLAVFNFHLNEKNSFINDHVVLNIIIFVSSLILLFGNVHRQKIIFFKKGINILFIKDIIFNITIILLPMLLILSQDLITFIYLLISLSSLIFYKKHVEQI